MIGLAMQKFPELQDGALLLRTMEMTGIRVR